MRAVFPDQKTFENHKQPKGTFDILIGNHSMHTFNAVWLGFFRLTPNKNI